MTEPVIKYGREIGREPARGRFIELRCGCGNVRHTAYKRRNGKFPDPDRPCQDCYRAGAKWNGPRQ